MTGEVDTSVARQLELVDALRQAGGLVHDDLGRLVVTESLREQVWQTESVAKDAEPVNEEERRERWLDTRIGDVIYNHGLWPQTRNNLVDRLPPLSIHTFRDVMVVGLNDLKVIPGLGLSSRCDLGRVMLRELNAGANKSRQHELKDWLNKPTLEDIVRFSPKGLSQVTSHVLRTRNDIHGYHPPSGEVSLPHTVQDVLDMSVKTDASDVFGPGAKTNDLDLQRFQYAAGEFAQKYQQVAGQVR